MIGVIAGLLDLRGTALLVSRDNVGITVIRNVRYFSKLRYKSKRERLE